jgi:hypothetical protein
MVGANQDIAPTINFEEEDARFSTDSASLKNKVRKIELAERECIDR